MRRAIGFFSVVAALNLAGCDLDFTGLEQLDQLCLSPCGGYGGPSGGGYAIAPCADRKRRSMQRQLVGNGVPNPARATGHYCPQIVAGFHNLYLSRP